MIINQHVNNGEGWGNGGHGYCIHCGLVLVTDLGYCSWDDTTCINRPIIESRDIPAQLHSYAQFNGYVFREGKFVKAYGNVLTIDQLNKKMKLALKN